MKSRIQEFNQLPPWQRIPLAMLKKIHELSCFVRGHDWRPYWWKPNGHHGYRCERCQQFVWRKQ